MVLRSYLKYLLFFLLPVSIAVTGCGPSTVSLKFDCEDKCNDNNAVVVQIFQLKSAGKFTLASRESLLRMPEATLEDELISGSKLEKTIVPGSSIDLKDIELYDDTKYIGLIADFFNPSSDGWRIVINPEEDGDDLRILIGKNSLQKEKM